MHPKHSVKHDLAAGAIAGALARLSTAPLDLIRIRLQVDKSKDAGRQQFVRLLTTIANVWKNEGVRALWNGNLSATYLWISYSAVQFGVYGFLQEKTAALIECSKLRNFVCGALAGCMSTSCTYPFDVMRTQFAVQGAAKVHHSILGFVSYTLKDRGVRGFYMGASPALLQIMPYMGLSFAIFESVMEVTRSENASRWANPATAGALAGGISKLIVYPMDTMKKRMQVANLPSHTKYDSLLHCIQQTAKQEGIAAFYKGLVPTTLKSVLQSSIVFWTYETTKVLLAAGQES